MDAIVTALGAQQTELSGIVSGLDEGGWQRPSRCPGWTVSDVVLHLAQTNELAIASASGRFDAAITELADGLRSSGSVDDGADQMVAGQRGQPGAAVCARWQNSADDLSTVLRTCDPRQRVKWVAGELAARTLATTRLAETWIHTGDVATAFGPLPTPTDRLWPIARLAWRTLPYAFARAGRELAGPVAFHLEAPSGEAWDLVPDAEPVTVIRGDAHELCLVAGRRARPEDTALQAEGPDGDAVLELVRTFA
ncbi:MAG: maleylpyruvate isomerase family mycothiol-dependent enzyme [Actinomycetota bacterium]|nr:maleylpyruvate isomerase family mycothiol-dependent enzyme [Actinomycetota bacterium]